MVRSESGEPMVARQRRAFFRVECLAQAFDPRRNSLAMMRLLLAGTVVIAHGLLVGFGHQPGVAGTHVSDIAVDAFFVLSGFLVAASFLHLQSLSRYAWHRFLRIMPGFWVCLVMTAVLVAPLAAVLDGRAAVSVFSADVDPAFQYPIVNGFLPILQYGIADLQVPTGETALDGSLWTLQYEAVCYAILAAIGFLGLLGRRWALPVLTVLVWLSAVADAAGLIPVDVPVLDNQQLLRFLLVFLLGACGRVYARHIPVGRGWGLVAGAATAASLVVLDDYRLAGAVPFAYLCLYAACRLPLRWNPSWDLSYGLYVYHWPAQFLLAMAGASALGEWGFVSLSLLLALGAAALSWVLVEGPALRLKDARWVDRWRPLAFAHDPSKTPQG
jgi:peptidoglycan/LPS O-acetylase OafA/YrhL